MGYQNILDQKIIQEKLIILINILDYKLTRFGLNETFWSGSIKPCWAQTIIQEKLTKFTKILNNIKSSCITFCTNMFGYFHHIYCLQEESTHFVLKALTNFVLEVLILIPKNNTRKINKFTMIFEWYQVFIYNFLFKMIWYLH